MVFALKSTHNCLLVTLRGSSKVERKFKGRGVLLGNQVKNQSFEAAMFQDLGNSPASFEASRWADFLGCHDGWDAQMADAVGLNCHLRLCRVNVIGVSTGGLWFH